MKKPILFGILILVLLVSGCGEEGITGNIVKETVTKYVCPDGSVVDNQDKCEFQEPTPQEILGELEHNQQDTNQESPPFKNLTN